MQRVAETSWTSTKPTCLYMSHFEEAILILGKRSKSKISPSQIQAAGKGLQLLLSQPLLLLQVLLPDEQRRLGLDEAPVVL